MLRLVFFGISCAFGIELHTEETERVFAEAKDDQVSSKSYDFGSSRTLTVRGEVDEHEPESIWIRLSGKDASQTALDRIVGLAKFEYHRWRLDEEGDYLKFPLQ
jgi:hypothetical protein